MMKRLIPHRLCVAGRIAGSALRAAVHAIPVLVGLLLLSPMASGLDPNVGFRQYVVRVPALKSDSDGRPTDIVQDESGALWVAKTDELIRFDGLYRDSYQVSDEPNLYSNAMRRLFVDADGRLIIISDSGVSMFADNRFIAMAAYRGTSQRMNTVAQLPTGELLFGGESGLYRLPTDRFEAVFPELGGQTITSLRWFDDAMWIGGTGRLWSMRNNRLREHDLPAALNDSALLAMEIHQGQLWVGTETGLWRFQNDTLVASRAFTEPTVIRALVSDQIGSLWFGGTDVMGRIVPDGHTELIDFEGEAFGHRADVRALLEDDRGNLWIARDTGSVVGVGDANVIRLSATEGLPLAKINALSASVSGAPLIGHDLGVSVADSRSASTVLDAREQQRAANVHAVIEDSGNVLWLGSDSGVALFTADGIERTPDALRAGVTSSVLVIIEQRPGLVWIGTTNGLYQWENGTLTRSQQLVDRRIEALHAGPTGQLWVGTNHGLYYRRGGEFVHVSLAPIPEYASVTSITSLPSGYMAASVRDHGVLVGRGDEWRLLGNAQGLSRDSTFYLAMAPDGYVWGVTSSGVYRVPALAMIDRERKKLPVRTILSTRSRYRPEIDVACCSGVNGSAAIMHEYMLYVSSPDGVLFVDTRSARQEQAMPVPYLDASTLKRLDRWSKTSDAVVLPSDRRRLRLTYSAIQLMSGSNVRFRYRLGGDSGSWKYASRDNDVTLRDIAPGKQLFELQASVRLDEWSPSDVSLSLTREPAFIETKYFYVAIACLLIAIYMLLIWVRARWLRYRVQHIEGLIHKRTEGLREVNADLNQANAALTRVSHTDALTGLHNRRYLEVNNHLLALADKEVDSQNDCTAIVLVDIDFFKRINDERGHVAGDTVLQQFADVLRSFVRADDEVIRWGGEEFLLLLRYRAGQLPAILERICRSVRSHRFKLDHASHVDVTVSIGAIALPTLTLRRYTNRLDDLFQCADMSLYSVKRNGRDGWAGVSAGDECFRQAATSVQIAEDMLELVETGVLEWHSSRPEIALDADTSVVQLVLVREGKETQQ